MVCITNSGHDTFKLAKHGIHAEHEQHSKEHDRPNSGVGHETQRNWISDERQAGTAADDIFDFDTLLAGYETKRTENHEAGDYAGGSAHDDLPYGEVE